MLKSNLRLAFTDMWGFVDRTAAGELSYEFNPNDNYFTDLFSLKYNVIVDQKNPDLLIYSVFGNSYNQYSCKKILFSGEHKTRSKAHLPHYNDSTVTLSHYTDEYKEIFMPLWVLHTNWFNKSQPRSLPNNPCYSITLEKITKNRERFLKDRKFCLFLNNNPIEDRIQLFNLLQQKEHVDSYGNLHNNTGKSLRGTQEDKVKLLHDYKFNIAFENCYHSGYNTEKIIEPLEAGCIPIYSGGEKVKEYFNEKSFFYRNNYSTLEELANAVFLLAGDKDRYVQAVLENPLKEDIIFRDFAPITVLNKIEERLNL